MNDQHDYHFLDNNPHNQAMILRLNSVNQQNTDGTAKDIFITVPSIEIPTPSLFIGQ